MPAHVAVIERFQIDMIEQNRPFRWLEKPRDELDQGRLASDRYGPTWPPLRPGVRSSVMSDKDVWRFRSRRILKTYAAQLNASFQAVYWHFSRERSLPCSGSCSKMSFSRFSKDG